MIMILNLRERIIMPEIFPEKGSMSEQIMLEEILKLIQITEEEQNEYNIKYKDGRIVWNENLDTNKEFDFTESQLSLLRTTCIKLDQEKQITRRILPICKKILNI